MVVVMVVCWLLLLLVVVYGGVSWCMGVWLVVVRGCVVCGWGL